MYSTLGISAFTYGLTVGALEHLRRCFLPLLSSPSSPSPPPPTTSSPSSPGEALLEWLRESFPGLVEAATSVIGGEALRAVLEAALGSARTAGACALASLFVGLWALSVSKGDVSIVDSIWSLGFLLLAWVYNHHPDTLTGFTGRKQLVMGCVALWAVRLAGYITWRNHGQGEDYRYKAMRRAIGPKFWWFSLFSVFGLQAALCFTISQPLLAAQTGGPDHFTAQDIAGGLVWLTGFLFEAIGDLQLSRFKSNPENKGKLLTTGLWRFTRHPNYFGNAAMFWGFWLIAASTTGGWKTIYSPALMTFLLLKVSGVALLETGLKKRKPGYESYIASTSSFFPWFPAKKQN